MFMFVTLSSGRELKTGAENFVHSPRLRKGERDTGFAKSKLPVSATATVSAAATAMEATTTHSTATKSATAHSAAANRGGTTHSTHARTTTAHACERTALRGCETS